MDENSISFYTKVSNQFVKKTITFKPEKISNKVPILKPIKFSNLPSSISSKIFKDKLDKLKFYGKIY